MGGAVSVLALPLIGWVANLFSKPPRAPPPNLAQVEVESREEIIRKARQAMGVDCVKFYNFAVSGQSGVGKSSFVNAVLSLEGKAACSVGEVEMTQKTMSYCNPKWPSLKLWDLPGAGTARHPANTYFEDKKLYVFDAILLLFADRFLEVDFEILRSARKSKTPCVFVRTKCDLAVKSRAKRERVNAMEASKRFRADVLGSFHEGLEKAGLKGSALPAPPELFFISNEFLSLFLSNDPDSEDAYGIHDRKAKLLDYSLPSMDESRLITYLVDVAKTRA